MAETIPGGRYVGADGKLHDANGKPITDEGTPIETAAAPKVKSAKKK